MKQSRPLSVGSRDPIAGRSTPAIRRRPKSAPAMMAPLFPALTKASARPAATICTPRTMEEAFLLRTAWAGCSSMAMTSGASSICAHLPAPAAVRASSTWRCGPRKTISTPSFRCASTPPATIWEGAWSPPTASRAIFRVRGSGPLAIRPLNVEVADGLGVGLDEVLAGIDLVAHQDVEDLVRLDRVLDFDAHQHPVLGIHGRDPEL